MNPDAIAPDEREALRKVARATLAHVAIIQQVKGETQERSLDSVGQWLRDDCQRPVVSPKPKDRFHKLRATVAVVVMVISLAVGVRAIATRIVGVDTWENSTTATTSTLSK